MHGYGTTELLSIEAPEAAATLILAHGAGAPMDSDFMNLLCKALAGRSISTVRFEFPYMRRRREEGTKRPPDRQAVLVDTWRQVYENVKASKPEGKLLIGGKSLGGRMASLIAGELQPDGFCCFGYPFHPPGKAGKLRTEHFPTTRVSGLILQGTRDPFGKPGEIDPDTWPANIRLVWLEEGDHDFRPRKRSGLTQTDIIARAAREVAAWIR